MILKSVQFTSPRQDQMNDYPFHLPLVQAMEKLQFEAPVTIFVGDNGSGKSTILEAIAAAVGSINVGADNVEEDASLQPARALGKTLRCAWSVKTKKGFFLRAEDFLNFARRMSRTRQEMVDRLAEVEEEYKDRSVFAQNQARMAYQNSISALDRNYGHDLDARSHGESFIKLFQSRFIPGGLYLLDEPETPLSPMKQLSFISMLKEMVEQGSQFIIVTHSPIIMAFPGAVIYNFDALPIEKANYEELEHVNLMRDFLNKPELYLRHL
jgi:predicted ATPase